MSRGYIRLVLVAAVVVLACAARPRPRRATAPGADLDGDGLGDALEQALLQRFAPRFQVSRSDCAGLPAVFAPGRAAPTPVAENGTIYGQVFPLQGTRTVEIHYYDLWASDCGADGHALDAEHVAVLAQAPEAGAAPSQWRALYWYAAAHENTVCDVSEMARAGTLGATTRGAKVWISAGKHAAFFRPALCSGGCGNDRCDDDLPLPAYALINLGEPGHPLHGADWIAYAGWPLAAKMRVSNFPAPALARLNAMPRGQIALFHTGRHPLQGVIAISSHTEQALAGGGDNATVGLALAQTSTGNAFQKAYRDTAHALKLSVRGAARFLHLIRR